ncbi:DNA primase [Dethiosulfatibacter aminovorans DSM 17477]|uniref:DNA primase n=1 Tax=Dethiosulfatibacter aminovorans DSM 17477 TaxID=1121476 RepID=A0A1M6DSE2_9FIRM|nr:DNA primase [Dethiosulfatibacter aminovorans]SHI76121.1 DNA primase [Dethiosulfatibacter aminovorans DSM 17477]
MPNSINEYKIEEILNLNDIVEVIGELITLKKAGANYSGLCPFHKEKTPSFVVSPDKQIYHCFGCGEGGDAISFIMNYKNLSFMESLEYLGDRVGIKVEKTSSSQKQDRYKINYEMNRDAAVYFYKQLSQNKQATEYLRKRGISNEARKLFGIGFSQNKWDGLIKYLEEKGYKKKDMEVNGLIIKSDKSSSYYDRFRNRVIFPIFDVKKRIIGFGGRVLGNELPKYINSPDSPIFNKGRNLYNLNNAKSFSHRDGIILTEGYMDVIKLSINGFENAVASLGTALTVEQVKLMKKYSKSFYISYDSDGAGKKAAVKAANLLKSNDLQCRVLLFPDKKDPDEFISQYGRAKYKERLENSLEYFEFLDYFLSSEYDLNSDKGKLNYIREMIQYLNNVNNAVEKELYIDKISKKLNISKDSIFNLFKKSQHSKRKNEKNVFKKIDMGTGKTNSYEVKLLDLLKKNPELSEYIKSKYKEDIFKNTKYKSEFYSLMSREFKNDELQGSSDINLTQQELIDIADDYINKIRNDGKKKIRNMLYDRLMSEPDNEMLLKQIKNIDEEIN